MRLTANEIKTLVDAAKHCFGETASIWLFGSRVDDSKKGGDIDLYIETDMTQNIVAAKLKMREEIWPTFGEQKIDILIRSRLEAMTPIQEIAKSTGINLKNQAL